MYMDRVRGRVLDTAQNQAVPHRMQASNPSHQYQRARLASMHACQVLYPSTASSFDRLLEAQQPPKLAQAKPSQA